MSNEAYANVFFLVAGGGGGGGGARSMYMQICWKGVSTLLQKKKGKRKKAVDTAGPREA